MQKPTDRMMKLIIDYELFKSKFIFISVLLTGAFTAIGYNVFFDATFTGFILAFISAAILSVWVRKIVCDIKYSALINQLYGKDQKAFFEESSYATEYFKYQASKLKPDGSNLQEITEAILDDVDKPEVSSTAVELTIVDMPEKPIGSYLDAKIYEWIDVAGGVPGEKVRFEFYRTVDNINNYEIERDCILIHPGIVYKLVRISSE